MAATITACKKTLNDTATVSTDDTQETQYFLIDVTESNATPYEVAVATYAPAAGDTNNVAMPQRGTTHPINNFMAVKNKTANRLAADGKYHPNKWVVTANYSLTSFGGSAPGNTANSRNIVVKIAGVESTVYTQKTKGTDPKPIRNAVGDLYPDPQPLTLYDESITITYEKDTISADDYSNARGKINSDTTITMSLPQGDKTWSRTFAKYQLLVKAWDYEVSIPKSGTAASVWSCTLTLLYRPDGWLEHPPEKGYRWKDSDGKLTEWSSTSEYLDSDGHKLDPGSSLVTLALPVQINDETAMASLLGAI